MLNEQKVQQGIRKECSATDNRIFRNAVGSGYSPHAVYAALGCIYDPELKKRVEKHLNKGIFQYGFGKGSSDLIAIQQVTITPDMVGKKVGVFCAIEVKDPDHKTDRDHLERQQKFINVIKSLGGRAGFATSPLDTYDILNQHE